MNEIRFVGDPVLRSPTDPIADFDDDLRRLVERMFRVMYSAQGVGLAANQIGVGVRVFVMDCDGLKAVLVNPVLRDLSAETVEGELEGCLSVPGRHSPTPRSVTATVVGRDDRGAPVELTASGVRARCFQHEVDHLDGRLYLDRLVGDVRREALRALRGEPHGWRADVAASFAAQDRARPSSPARSANSAGSRATPT